MRPSANQDEIAREARAMTPEECVVRGAAKIYLNENRVVGITSPVAHLVGEMREVYAGTDWVRMDDPIGEPRSIGKDCRLS